MSPRVDTRMTRRRLLGQAVGAAALVTRFEFMGTADAQAPPSSESIAPRIRDSLDFGWKFLKGDAPGAQQPDFSDSNWRSLDLPHDWSIEGPYNEKEPTGGQGGYLPAGIGWYRKQFRLPESYRDRKVLIEFDGVYENSEVWINGQYLGKRPLGYMSFAYDLTPHLSFGSRDNLIAVKVDNSRQPNSRWYSGSGIYRHTWLLVTNKVHVAHCGTYVTTPQVSKESSIVRIKTRIRNEDKGASKYTLVTSILDKDGKIIQSAEASQDLAANSEYEFAQQVKVEKSNLWSVENPYLYKVRSTVRQQDRVVDEYDTPLGIREIVFDADRGFLLNGEPVKLNGVCLHHDGGCVGAAVPEVDRLLPENPVTTTGHGSGEPLGSIRVNQRLSVSLCFFA